MGRGNFKTSNNHVVLQEEGIAREDPYKLIDA